MSDVFVRVSISNASECSMWTHIKCMDVEGRSVDPYMAMDLLCITN